MDGYEATRRIRELENPHLAEIIIPMTANTFGGRQRAFAVGVNAHPA